MLIPIHVESHDSSSKRSLPPQLAQFGADEIVLIELQGALEVEGDSRGQFVGKLRVDATTVSPMSFQKSASLLIGHHLLEGKLVNLPKPLAVLHRSATGRPNNQDAPTDDMLIDDDIHGPRKADPPSWAVMAIVKRKMVFSNRPMPMVGKIANRYSGCKTREDVGSIVICNYIVCRRRASLRFMLTFF
ncbi:Chromosome transmission fidelity protein 8 [Grifola frondosa]|uniref:Chromosome transmission fidelity protein 8 n=1 Tax=Grifola frondosa TaxID=5627 RepID=A0A1C7M732_GRIFR|nr:Chromosome transmission fidelity protein 8 [Grifola frondosa]